jgi:hypothetical protein
MRSALQNTKHRRKNTQLQTPNSKPQNPKTGLQMGGGVLALVLSAGAVLAALGTTGALGALPRQAMVIAKQASSDAEAAETSAKQKQVIIEAIEPGGGRGGTQEVAWLGVSADEVSEALDAQLGLDPGEGLLVSYVAPESPAGKAGLHKNDVLLQFGDQLLVHPQQLRKLVRMRKVGEKVDLTIFRGGKKQSLSVTLAKTTRRMSLFEDGTGLPESFRDLHHQFSDIKIGDQVRTQLKALHESLARSGLDKQKLNAEINKSLEEARKAILEALRHTTNLHGLKDLEQLMHGGVGLGKDSTVIVKNDQKSVKTMVKTDDEGSYVIVANPRKRLTAHDAAGKLLFDGEIETAEQQQKVPHEVWDKVQPMLEQMSSDKAGELEEEEDKGDQGARLQELPGARELDPTCT